MKKWVYVEDKIPQKLRGLKRREISELCAEALMYFKREEHSRSAQVFQKVLDIDPFEERARFYLERKIPQGMHKLAKKKIKTLYNEALRRYKNKDYEGAKKVFHEILSIDPKQRKAQLYLGVKIPEAEDNALKQKIALLYKDAIGCFENNQYEDAQFVFKKILELDPQQQKAKRYINEEIPQARQAYIEARQQTLIQTMDTVLQKEKEPAIVVVEEVVVQGPQVEVITIKEEAPESARRDLIKSTLAFLESKKETEAVREVTVLEETIVLEDEIPVSKESMFPEELDGLYEAAFDYYNKGNYMVAKEHFSKILTMDPDQRIAELYLNNIKEALRQ